MPELVAPPKSDSPAPVAPPVAAPSTPTPPAAPATDGVDNPFAEVDSHIEGLIKKGDTPPASTKGKEEPPKPAASKTPEPAKSAPAAQPAPKQLREELDRVKGELKTKADAIAQMEARIAEAEKRGKDTTALTERLTSMEKDMEALRAENRALKQESSPEFKAKYDAPFNKTADKAKSVVEAIQVEDAEAGTVRQATWDDFTKLYQLNEFVANKEAKRLFGEDGAAVAMRYYTELHRLDDARQDALQEERANYKKRQEAEEAEKVTRRQQIDQIWEKTNKELSETVEHYHDSPEDKEASEVRQKGYQIFDAPPKTIQQKIIKDAHIRQMVAEVGVDRLKIARLTAERDALKTELDGLKDAGGPGKPKRPGGASAPATEPDFENALRKHMAGA